MALFGGKTRLPRSRGPDKTVRVFSVRRVPRHHSAMKLHRLTAALAAVLLALAPGRAAADPAAIFVGNYNGGSPNADVLAYDATGAAATGYAAPTGFSNPKGIAYNPASGMLYVADINAGKIRTFNAATGMETSIGFASAAGLDYPIGLALNAGVLYAANYYGNTAVTAYNAATGAAVTSGFTSPTGLSNPYGLAVNNTMLFVANYGNGTLGAYNLATGVASFTITGLSGPTGVALFGNDLFVANTNGTTVGEYDARSGAVINASFVTGLSVPEGLAILGNRLLVAIDSGSTVGAYGIPDTAATGNVPTSATPSFLTGLNGPTFIAIGNIPEPSTWMLLGMGAGMLGLATLRRRVLCV